MACSWRNAAAQVDLAIDRKDDTVNICEMKYAKDEFEITKECEAKLQNKLTLFTEDTGTRKSLILTMVTTHGVKQNAHSGIVQSEVTLDDLFVS